jgi:hypothetical protein
MFEDINNDGYKEVSNANSPLATGNDEDFTDKQMYKLKSLGFDNTTFGSRLYKNKVFKREFYYTIHILRSNDDWYYVTSLPSKKGSFVGGKKFLTRTNFKCDQWDGLMSCLKNEYGIK